MREGYIYDGGVVSPRMDGSNWMVHYVIKDGSNGLSIFDLNIDKFSPLDIRNSVRAYKPKLEAIDVVRQIVIPEVERHIRLEEKS